MSAYIERDCAKHGYWDADVDDAYAECPKCVEEGCAPSQRLAALESSHAELVEALKWAEKYIDDGLSFDKDERPDHECEFYTNPEKGECDFCTGYTGLGFALANAAKLKGGSDG